MRDLDKKSLENIVFDRAFYNAQVMEKFEWRPRFEEGRWLLKEFIKEFERWESS